VEGHKTAAKGEMVGRQDVVGSEADSRSSPAELEEAHRPTWALTADAADRGRQADAVTPSATASEAFLLATVDVRRLHLLPWLPMGLTAGKASEPQERKRSRRRRLELEGRPALVPSL